MHRRICKQTENQECSSKGKGDSYSCLIRLAPAVLFWHSITLHIIIIIIVPKKCNFKILKSQVIGLNP